jgi:hypothetical protein
MRKAFGIVIGCTLLCGLVMAAMHAVSPPTATVPVVINLNRNTEGVDPPWFELSYGRGDTVQWTAPKSVACTVGFKGDSPFAPQRTFAIPARGQSPVLKPTAAAAPPAGAPPGKVYKVYRYYVDCGAAGFFDPGGGMTP